MSWEQKLKEVLQYNDLAYTDEDAQPVINFIKSLLKQEREDLGEVWKIIGVYNGKYEISNSGFIRNREDDELVAQCSNDRGYRYVNLYSKDKKDRIIRSVSRLVALYFIPNPNNLPTVNHIDGNKENNNWLNLEWLSYSDNMQHAYSNGLKPTKLSPYLAGKIRELYKENVMSMPQLATSYNVCVATIKEIIHNKIYKPEPSGEQK